MSISPSFIPQRSPSSRSFSTNSSSGPNLARPSRFKAQSLAGGSSSPSDALSLPVSSEDNTSELAYLDLHHDHTALQDPTLVTTTGLPDKKKNTSSEFVTARQMSIGDDTLGRERVLSKPQPPPLRNVSFSVSDHAIMPNFRDSVLTQRTNTTSSSLYPQSTSTTSGTDSPTYPRSIEDVLSFDPDVADGDEQDDGDHPLSRAGFDGDDVSHRLRLLVKNNYFLPPAHSKPLPSDFAAAAVTVPASKKLTRSGAPTFLDLFRVGKSKSKPPTPSGVAENLTPILRTTSDSTTASPRPAQRVSPPTNALPGTGAGCFGGTRPQTVGRVVVVREKMEDLLVAAKQAEMEVKARVARKELEAQQRQPRPQPEPQPQPEPTIMEQVIDPTDAVDLPPPGEDYPFAIQASALRGLGVLDSLGADILADRLPPPPNSPGMSSLDPEEHAWRKRLLHEAVGHSLENSPDVSMSSPSSPFVTPPMTPSPTSLPLINNSRQSQSMDRVKTHSVVSTKRQLGQPILKQALIEPSVLSGAQSHPPYPNANPRLSQQQQARIRGRDSGLSSGHLPSYLPRRAETPAANPTPLAPPPRSRYHDGGYPLLAQAGLPLMRLGREVSTFGGGAGAGPSSLAGSKLPRVVKKSKSQPMLSDSSFDLVSGIDYASAAEGVGGGPLVMTPPPVPQTRFASRSSSQTHSYAFSSSFDTSRRAAESIATTSESAYSDEEGEEEEEEMDTGRRPSTNLSAFLSDGRRSFSELSSQPSPTTSAFMDALNEPYGSTPSLVAAAVGQQGGQSTTSRTDSHRSEGPRYSTTSPPPRVSSSFSTIALSPPPVQQQQQQCQLLPYQRESVTSTIMQERHHPPTIQVGLDGGDEGARDGESGSPTQYAHYPSPASTPPPPSPPIPTPTPPPPTVFDRRGHLSAAAASVPSKQLLIPTVEENAEPGSSQNAPPTSPLEFFDQVQMRDFAAAQEEDGDDDSSSSVGGDADRRLDSEGEEEQDITISTTTTGQSGLERSGSPRTVGSSPGSVSNTRSSSSVMMKLGNRSLPYVGRLSRREREERRPALPLPLTLANVTPSTTGTTVPLLPSLSPRKPTPLMRPAVGFTFRGPSGPVIEGNEVGIGGADPLPFRGPVFAEKRSSDLQGGYMVGRGSFDGILGRASYEVRRGSGSASPFGASARAQMVENLEESSMRAVETKKTARESLKRLDGMLVQHMEAEKDTFKRIGATMHFKMQSGSSAVGVGVPAANATAATVTDLTANLPS